MVKNRSTSKNHRSIFVRQINHPVRPRAKRSPDRTRGWRTVRLAPLRARVGLPAHSKQIEPVRLVRDAGWWAKVLQLLTTEIEHGAIQFAVTKLFGTGSQVPLLLVIDAIWKVG
jgi:hypothetical protein